MNREAQLARTRAAIARGRPAETPGPLPRAHRPPGRAAIDALLDQRETGVCVECGRSHEPANRQRLIRPMMHLGAMEIATEWSCFYGTPGDDARSRRAWEAGAGARRLHRDLAVIRMSGQRSANPRRDT